MNWRAEELEFPNPLIAEENPRDFDFFKWFCGQRAVIQHMDKE